MTITWLFEWNGVVEPSSTPAEVGVKVVSAQQHHSGRIWIARDRGPTSWWERLLGFGSRDIDPLLAVEWYDTTAGLIFFDGAYSEHRVLGSGDPAQFPLPQREHISHGELDPLPVEECVDKEFAFQVIDDALRTGVRPAHLRTRFVE